MWTLKTLRFVGLGVLLPVALASAQVIRPTPQLPAGATVERALEKAGQAVIRGVAVDAGAKPVANAKVQLRNLASLEVEQVGSANQIGEFSFVARPETPYVVEIADRNGRVIAVGDVIIAHVGDVAAATVTLPIRIASASGLFTETAGSVISAATSIGLTAVEATVLPFVSPEK
jgi:hypothetical protein